MRRMFPRLTMTLSLSLSLAACSPGEYGSTTSNGAAASGRSSTTIAVEGGIPVFRGHSANYRMGRGVVSGRLAAVEATQIGSYRVNDRTTVPFSVADITGRLRRVNVDGQDFAVIDRVRTPFLGSKLAQNDLLDAVARSAASMTNCAGSSNVFIKRRDYGARTFVVPLSCY